jgi:hypothetical protein
VTWTTRLRKDAALYGLPPARTGKRGRPRTRGTGLPALDRLAATAAFTPVTVTRYGKTAVISAAAITCLWPSVFGTRTVTVVLIRDRPANRCNLALVTTDTTATAAQVIERYASRWAAEVAIQDSKQVWYTTKVQPSTADMTGKLRRVLIAARFKAPRPGQPTPKKSTSSAWPGKTSPRNHESRADLA